VTARTADHTIAMAAIIDALSTIVRPLCLTHSCTTVCPTGTAKQRTAASPNPRRAHIEPLEACFHLPRTTTPATKQTSNVGNCIANIESNTLIWSVLFINVLELGRITETGLPFFVTISGSPFAYGMSISESYHRKSISASRRKQHASGVCSPDARGPTTILARGLSVFGTGDLSVTARTLDPVGAKRV